MIAIYVRVSTDEQAKKGYSLQDQLRQCRQKAGIDAEIIEYVDDGHSGEFLERPQLMKLRDDVKAGLIEKVIIYDPDRFSRKLMNQLIVTEEIEKNAELVFVNSDYQKTPEGMLFYQIRGSVAEFEKAKINERMSRGRRQKAREGKVLRDFKIYGYGYDKEKSQMIIEENEAEVIQLIFDLFTRPNGRVQGINGIAHYLTDRKIPTKRGAKVWHRQVVRQILMHEAYTGTFYQNRWNTEGMLGNKYKPKEDRVSMKERPREEWIEIKCPVIIDKTTFDYAQKLLGESRRRWAKKSKNHYLLSGLLRCADCGNTMTGRLQKNWGKYEREYSDVKSTAGAKYSGCGRRVKADAIEKEVWETIRSWLDNPTEIAVAAESQDDESTFNFEEAEIARLEKEIEKARGGRKKLLKLFASDPDMPEEEIRESIRDLKTQEDELNETLNEVKMAQEQMKQTSYSANLLSEAMDYYRDKGVDDLTFEDKQELIRIIVKEIRVFDDRIKIHNF